MIFPENAVMEHYDFGAYATGGTNATGTILSFIKSSSTALYCDEITWWTSDLYPANKGLNDVQVFTKQNCQTILYEEMSGNDGMLEIIYVPSGTTASSSVVSVYNGFSYGEVLQVVFLFLIFGVVAYSFLFHWLRGYKIKN